MFTFTAADYNTKMQQYNEQLAKVKQDMASYPAHLKEQKDAAEHWKREYGKMKNELDQKNKLMSEIQEQYKNLNKKLNEEQEENRKYRERLKTNLGYAYDPSPTQHALSPRPRTPTYPPSSSSYTQSYTYIPPTHTAPVRYQDVYRPPTPPRPSQSRNPSPPNNESVELSL
jgi:hypothetical protein